jgi:hypothetical protein
LKIERGKVYGKRVLAGNERIAHTCWSSSGAMVENSVPWVFSTSSKYLEVEKYLNIFIDILFKLRFI